MPKVEIDTVPEIKGAGYDLPPRPDDPSRVDDAFIPEDFFNQINAAIVAENRKKKLSSRREMSSLGAQARLCGICSITIQNLALQPRFGSCTAFGLPLLVPTS
ncbi:MULTISPECIES: hypothetical protein [Rhizobium]|uniref:Uncharacterized protein n=1 Tax=Rhizobium favelukesii TaxID=348824 RepID=W6RMM7_9HYPH|nr:MULTISPECIES: hypothetical protein [Rhizobium]MCA0804870.1 hypothetical protein [Rhizobium sp. T1473]MCS0458293.1 hypothetical protein [Rhizobium favelukesii]UFS79757.1 hypothetical protein LPB79_00050 [Rhizobium sp. T136]CDM61460.1 hypothetical protein LPU83_pLPU83d_0089 [Rhizobium favelukesii]